MSVPALRQPKFLQEVPHQKCLADFPALRQPKNINYPKETKENSLFNYPRASVKKLPRSINSPELEVLSELPIPALRRPKLSDSLAHSQAINEQSQETKENLSLSDITLMTNKTLAEYPEQKFIPNYPALQQQKQSDMQEIYKLLNTTERSSDCTQSEISLLGLRQKIKQKSSSNIASFQPQNVFSDLPLRQPKIFQQTKVPGAQYVTVNFMDKQKLLVSSDSYHGIVQVGDLYKCIFCHVEIELDSNSKRKHQAMGYHTRMLEKYPHVKKYGSNLTRELADSYFCTVCHKSISSWENLTHHLESQDHRQKLKKVMLTGIISKA